jgi:hypothetical protein
VALTHVHGNAGIRDLGSIMGRIADSPEWVAAHRPVVLARLAAEMGDREGLSACAE